ncbi:Coenzyme A disulfide reductase [bioreactor metagenome]|uniref:Coenzyme A disulfide reductase n=1 Tax=bioreactor metagenome TaxID=1076179 RepID=A0A644WWP2_9ZZZZ
MVVGGGFIGVEMVENLVHAQVKVTSLELADQVLTPLDFEMASMIHLEMKKSGVDLRLGTGLNAIEKNDGKLVCTLSDGSTVATDLVLLAIGVRSDNSLAKQAGLELAANGAIISDEYMRTSDPDIYAVGDAVLVEDFVSKQKASLPLAGPANRQGRIAADLIAGRDDSYEGTQGTMICKVFDLAAGATGNNEKQLKKNGMDYDKIYIHPNSHATYYPGAETLSMKLLYHPVTGKVLGSQAIGKEGVDKRIDVLATAIRAGLTVFDLQRLELCYAPPFSSAKDPVNMAGFTAANVIKGDLKQLFIEDLESLDPEKDFLVDIRTQSEYDQGTIGNAVLIPLDSIRDRLEEFPKDKHIVHFCRAGLRGYVGCRILMQHGFEQVYNLSGGYLTWYPCSR